MQKNNLICLIIATKTEAAPFIDALKLKSSKDKPFKTYANDKYFLILSGIGKANAASACAYICATESLSAIYNLGAAGAVKENISIGDIYQISKVVEPDRPHLRTNTPMKSNCDTICDFKTATNNLQTATLATQDKPVIELEHRIKVAQYADLVDMEAAAIVQVCKRFNVKCYLLKFVTDDLTDHDIVNNIKKYGNSFCEVIIKNIF